MTHSIFYDLETSDLNFIGQILNFSFIVVDTNWNVIDEFSSEIKINRLQLPRARAIAANRVDVLEHQKRAKYTEAQAMNKITDFLQEFVQNCGFATGQLIGFNSANFDLPYLRTSLIRNGFSPYHKVQNRDLFILSQKLWLTNQQFRDQILNYAEANSLTANLKLETLCKAHNLLEGKQLHESRDDVLLTIELAKTFLEQYGADVRSFEPYEGRPLHRKPRGAVYQVQTGVNKLEPVTNHYTLLQSENKSALWIDLDHFKKNLEEGQELKSAVRWIKFEAKIFLTDGVELVDPEYQALAKQALEEFKDLQIDNFFEQTTCDIEQFIYRIPFDSYKLLYKYMQDPKGSAQLSADEKELVRRYRLANYELGAGEDARMSQALKEYAEYRYGGQAQLAKTISEQQGKGKPDDFHPTIIDLIAEVDQVGSEDPESASLMQSLGEFYRKSEIFNVLKAE